MFDYECQPGDLVTFNVTISPLGVDRTTLVLFLGKEPNDWEMLRYIINGRLIRLLDGRRVTLVSRIDVSP